MSVLGRVDISHGSAVRKLGLSVASVGVGQVIAAGQAILLVPLFLRAWGQTSYGEWVALTAFMSYLTLVDLGGQSYIANLLTISFSRGDIAGFQSTLARGVSASTAVALAAFVGVAVVLVLPAGAVPPLAHALGRPESRTIVMLVSASLLVTVPYGVYNAVYRAAGLFLRGQTIGNVTRATELTIYAFLLFESVNPEQYACALLGGSIVRVLVVVVDLRRCSPVGRPRLSPRLAWEGRRYLGGSMLFWLGAVSNGLNQQGVVLVVAAVAGASAVTDFATQRTLAGAVGYVSALALSPMWPEMSRLFAQDRMEDLRRLSVGVLRLVVFLSSVVAACVWFLAPVIYPLWTGRHLYLDRGLLGVLLVQMVMSAGWATTSWSLLSCNRQRGVAVSALADAVLTICLGIWWGQRGGLVGVALASLAGDFVCGLGVYPFLASRFLSLSARALYRAMVEPAFWVATLCAALIGSGLIGDSRWSVIEDAVIVVAWCGATILLSHRAAFAWRHLH